MGNRNVGNGDGTRVGGGTGIGSHWVTLCWNMMVERHVRENVDTVQLFFVTQLYVTQTTVFF